MRISLTKIPGVIISGLFAYHEPIVSPASWKFPKLVLCSSLAQKELNGEAHPWVEMESF